MQKFSKNRIAIIGAGELGQQIAYHAHNNGYNIAGFFDDFATDSVINGINILGKIDDIYSSFRKGIFDSLVVGIGYKHFEFREAVFNRFKNDIPFATIIDKSAYIDKSAKIFGGG